MCNHGHISFQTKKAQERENNRATSFLLDTLGEHCEGDTRETLEVEENISDDGTGYNSSHNEHISLHATPTSASTRRAFPLPNYTPQYQDYGSYYDDIAMVVNQVSPRISTLHLGIEEPLDTPTNSSIVHMTILVRLTAVNTALQVVEKG